MPPHSRAQIHLGFQDKNGEAIQDKDHPFYMGWTWATVSGYSDWVPVAAETVSPPGTARMSVTLRFVGIGEAWFDDVKLVQSETAPVPRVPPGLWRTATFDMDEPASGDTEIELGIRNPFQVPILDLEVTASWPGSSADLEQIGPGEKATIPVTLHFPGYYSSHSARILLTGRFEMNGELRTVHWLVAMPVVSKDVLVAIKGEGWGESESLAPENAPLFEILGTVRNDKFVPNSVPLNLQAEDTLAFVVRLAGRREATGELELAWECLDYFFRPASGKTVVKMRENRLALLKVDLPRSQVNRIFKSGRDAGADRFRITCQLTRGGRAVGSITRDLKLRPAPMNAPRLGALDDREDTLPVFGNLRLMDEVICGDPKDPHLYREGGKGLSAKYSSEPLDYYGGSDRLTYSWQQTYRDHREEFTTVESILGKPCRMAKGWGWFAYRMGRGSLKPGRHYVLVIEYPEDESRNFLIWNAIDSRASFGFHTGSALGDPFTRQRFMQKVDLPLSGRFEGHYSLMTARKMEGWIAIHSMGARAAPFSKGAAVHSIRLYELGDAEKLDSLALKVAEPEDLPRRLIGFISEDATPSASDIHKYRLYGMNLYCPLALSYCGGTYQTNSGYVGWESRLFGPDHVENPHARERPGYYHLRPGIIEPALTLADQCGMTILPVMEYGGTGQLPREALAEWPDGSPHYYHWGTAAGKDGLRTARYLKDGTCIDMAHPAVGEDLGKLLTEFADLHARHSSFGGVVLTQRFQAWQVSYGPDALRRFAKNRNLKLPERNPGLWIFANHRAAFRQWHYERKRDNFLQAADALQRVQPGLRLLILNYNGGDDNLHFGSSLYWWDKKKGDEWIVPGAVSLPDISKLNLAEMIEDYTRPDVAGLSVGMNPSLYRSDRGLWNLAPVHYPFLSGNTRYLENFRTGEGSAVCFWWIYNEDAYRNHPGTGWNCPGLHGNEPAGRYCMLDEVLAMAASDPFLMGVRIGSMNRGFPKQARAFAAAYRSLPAVKSKVIAACDDPEVVVRRYDTSQGIYAAVINTGLGIAGKTVTLKTQEIGAKTVRNLVTRELLKGNREIVLQMNPASMVALRCLPDRGPD